MRVALLFCTLIALASCAPTPRGVRDTDVTMNAVVGVADTRLTGDWIEVAAIGRTPGGSWSITASPDGGLIVTGPDGVGRGSLGPTGRLTLSTFLEPLFLLWIDADDRTAVLGTRSGAPAIVLDRRAALPADRAKAVRDILDWNGYDLSQLR
ncbi:lipocalin [Maritimibacter dapengensis]|uniref:Lipocalin n=1 Tax=Maritimibacter dapengensis TaxID=2836868 RepID=A0ABS6T0Q0_9RHOB|nr:lipocalin [Maritimibacter dapengensis]MBV7378770.1 lipocalin [Maritimibacter dapengensis]